MIKNILIVLIISVIMINVLIAGTQDNTVIQIFNEAKRLFIKANDLAEQYPERALGYYKKSAFHFESIYLNHHIKNGKLFYNIGNAYYKTGQIGKAILYYKKALFFIPSDKNLLHNIEFVRSKRIDQINENEQNRILKILFFFHFKLSSRIKFTIFVIFFILFWTFASLVLVLRKNYYRRLSMGALFFSIVFLSSFVIDISYNMFNKTGVITVESVIARKGDSVTYLSSFQDPLHEGTEFKVIEKRRNWLNIQLVNGKECWIETKHAELVN